MVKIAVAKITVIAPPISPNSSKKIEHIMWK